MVVVMVLCANVINISVISCLSVLFVENKHRPAVSHRQILSHNVVSCAPRHEQNSNLQPKWR